MKKIITLLLLSPLFLPVSGQVFLKQFTVGNSPICDSTLSQMACDSVNNVLWMSTSNCLSRYNLQTKEWQSFTSQNSGLKLNEVRNVQIAPDGDLWIGSGYGGGLGNYSPQSNTWKYYDKTNSEIPENSFFDLAIDKDGFIWMAFENSGIVKFDGNNWTAYNTTNSNILSNKVYRIEVDANNNKWALTSKGLSKLTGNTFVNYINPEKLSYASVQSIDNDQVLLGTYMNGLFRQSNATSAPVRVNIGEPEINDVTTIECIAKINTNTYVLGTWAGASIFKLGSNSIERLDINNNDIKYAIVNSLAVNDSDLMIGTAYKGLLLARIKADYLKDTSTIISAVRELEIKETDQKFTNLYPNPANGELYVSILSPDKSNLLKGEHYKISVYSSNGNLVEKYNTSEPVFKIKTSTYSPGLYFIQVMKDDGSVSTGKAIIIN